ncbi:MAG: hypothetical protein PHF84_08220 [bacterium]|nr:hypothetical protein [bacterium]
MKTEGFQILLCVFFLATPRLSAGDSASGGIENDYKLTAGIMSTASALAPLAVEEQSLFYNPAGLDYSRQNIELFLAYAPVGDKISHYVSAGFRYPVRNLAFGISYINLSDEGIFIRDSSPVAAGTFGFNSTFLGFNLACCFFDYLHAGIRLKAMSQTIYKHSGWGFGLDSGILFKTVNPYQFTKSPLAEILNKLAIGIFLKNLLPYTLKLYEKKEQYPFQINFGIQYTSPKIWYFRFEPMMAVSWKQDEQEEISSGLMIMFNTWLQLNTGYAFKSQKPGIGIGVDLSHIAVNYAVSFVTDDIIYILDCKVRL